jgi:hypothetical protein
MSDREDPTLPDGMPVDERLPTEEFLEAVEWLRDHGVIMTDEERPFEVFFEEAAA